MKKIKIISVIVFIFIIMSIFNTTYAMDSDINAGNASEIIKQEKEKVERTEAGLKDPTVNPDSWEPKGQGSQSDVQAIKEKTGIILGVVNTVGAVVSVIALAGIGIKYMLGSIEEKAEYKSTMILYVIGAIMVFAATTIPNIIYNFASNI